MTEPSQTTIAPLPPAAQIQRALFVDIKATGDDLPVLISLISRSPLPAAGSDDGPSGDGVIGREMQQIVTDLIFADAALAKDLRVQHFEEWITELADRSAAEDRLVITWGDQLLTMADRHGDIGRRLAPDVVDLQELLGGGKGARKGRGREPQLADLLAAAGEPPPRHLNGRQSTQRLRYVRQQLLKHDAYESITSTAKGKWTKLLQQGEHDCHGLWKLLQAHLPGETR